LLKATSGVKKQVFALITLLSVSGTQGAELLMHGAGVSLPGVR